MSFVSLLALIGGPSALWYTHTHPLQHTEVCSYRRYRRSTGRSTQPITVYVPVYCDRPAGR